MNAFDGLSLNCSGIDIQVVLVVGNVPQKSIKLKGTKGRYTVKLACSKKRGSMPRTCKRSAIFKKLRS